jgi:pyridoxamine 5'-phosphate oxidase
MTTDFDNPRDFSAIELQAWQLLQRGVADRRHGFHHPVISTIGRNGHPKARVVILRAVEQEANSIRFHTDVRSEKWMELLANSKASATLYDEASRVQLRLEGVVKLHTQDDVARKAWLSSQPMGRVAYGVTPPPGAVIAEGELYTLPAKEEQTEIGFENFGVVLICITSLDWLHLKQAHNRRAHFDYTENTKVWLVP